jgi:hypothetical protein
MAAMELMTRDPRPLLSDLSTMSVDIADYTAGVLDTDGCFQLSKKLVPSITVTQAEKGYPMILFMYETFGGSINNHQPQTKKIQSSFMWTLNTFEDVARFAAWIAPHLTIKRREAEVLATFPTQNVHVIPVIAENWTTNEKLVFSTIREAAAHFHRVTFALTGDKVITVKDTDWTVRKALSVAQINDIDVKRQEIRDKLMAFHSAEHDPIPVEFVPSPAYLAGVVDGDGCLDVHGKNSQHHSVTQRCRPLLEMMQRHLGGTICGHNYKTAWEWSIYSCDGADRFLRTIEPFLVGKKEQARKILAMKPGGAATIHAELRDMKGNINRATPVIDKIKAGEDTNNFKTPPKDLPTGVHLQANGRYKALLGVDKRDYSLGTFSSAFDAQEQYEKYKALAQREMRTGEKLVDWETLFGKEENLNRNRLPEQVSKQDHNEKCIYNTASRTYQVKVNNRAFGTYETLKDAIVARDRAVRILHEEAVKEAFENPMRHIYMQESARKGVRFVVKIDAKAFGTFDTREQALKVRNNVYKAGEAGFIKEALDAVGLPANIAV